MSCYNRTKAESRQQEIEERKAEIAAIDAGEWPRDLNDDMRWGVFMRFNDMAEKTDYARRLCVETLEYLEGIPARINAGELPGWEP
jgi:hypothetical protein